jgi:phosphatidate cytidylyltransferase|tara:strand:+ start:77 stop:916 length:840 start_codon:yes stop_codon:yes gene_type:complete
MWREGLEKEFKQTFINRSATGLMMVIPFLGLIYVANTFLTTIVIVILSMIVYLEWSGLTHKKNLALDVFFIILFTLGVLSFNVFFLYNLTALLALFWLIFSIFLFINKLGSLNQNLITFDNNILKLAVILGFLSSLLLLIQIEEINHLLILIIIVNTSLVDTFAYLSGSRFGKTPLLKNISPNKTLEGFFGGMAASLIFALLMSYLYQLPTSMVLIISFSAFFSFVGDYFMSYLKRRGGLKDTGSILPGHGGILDRIDSHLSAATIFTFLYLTFQISGI